MKRCTLQYRINIDFIKTHTHAHSITFSSKSRQRSKYEDISVRLRVRKYGLYKNNVVYVWYIVK